MCVDVIVCYISVVFLRHSVYLFVVFRLVYCVSYTLTYVYKTQDNAVKRIQCERKLIILQRIVYLRSIGPPRHGLRFIIHHH